MEIKKDRDITLTDSTKGFIQLISILISPIVYLLYCLSINTHPSIFLIMGIVCGSALFVELSLLFIFTSIPVFIYCIIVFFTT